MLFWLCPLLCSSHRRNVSCVSFFGHAGFYCWHSDQCKSTVNAIAGEAMIIAVVLVKTLFENLIENGDLVEAKTLTVADHVVVVASSTTAMTVVVKAVSVTGLVTVMLMLSVR